MTTLFWKLVAANLAALNLCQLWPWLWFPYVGFFLAQVVAVFYIEQ
jgi:hypothetical protein